MPFVTAVNVGAIAPLGPDHVPSAFVKTGVAGSVAVAELGLEGDSQADLSVHGGPEKAVYGYAAAHYPAWRADFPEHADRFVPGGMGENLTIEGLTEADICVGDIHAIGSALLQVCQPRQPCFKFALRYADNRLPKAMVRSGRAGWYYRVLRPGRLAATDAVSVQDREGACFPFSRLVALIGRGNATEEELALLADLPGLASQWREEARERLRRLREA